jgi:hypothetical protein
MSERQPQNTAATNTEQTSMFRWVYWQFHRPGSARAAILFAAAYGIGLVCMVLAFRFLRDSGVLPSSVFYVFLWPILALPAVFTSASIWVLSRRNQIVPTAATLMAIFSAVALIYFSLVIEWKR